MAIPRLRVKKGVAKGNQNPVDGQGTKIRRKQEADGLTKMACCGGITYRH